MLLSSRIATSRLPATVLRSSGAWPCTSALGLFTRRYSAGRSKCSPLAKPTVRVRLSLCSRSSVGHGDDASVMKTPWVTVGWVELLRNPSRAPDVAPDDGYRGQIGQASDLSAQPILQSAGCAQYPVSRWPSAEM